MASSCSCLDGSGLYPRLTICMVRQKMGPHTSGLIPMGGNFGMDAIYSYLYMLFFNVCNKLRVRFQPPKPVATKLEQCRVIPQNGFQMYKLWQIRSRLPGL